MSEASTAPALGYSIVANLGGDRQITVQCFVGSDEPLVSINKKIDRALAVVDRQKARYELEDLYEERHKTAQTLAQFEEDLARLDLDFEASQDSLRKQITEVLTASNDAFDKGYNEYVTSGRRGDYKPTGATKQAMSVAEAQKHQIEQAMQKNANERDQALQQTTISVQRFKQALALADTKIAEREAKLKD